MAKNWRKMVLNIPNERTPSIIGLLLGLTMRLGPRDASTVEIKPLRLDSTGNTATLMTLLLLNTVRLLEPMISVLLSGNEATIHM